MESYEPQDPQSVRNSDLQQREPLIPFHKEVLKIQQHDNANKNEQLISYWCQIGLDDSDSLHSLMAVKEMIYAGYGVNANYDCKQTTNSGILIGDREFIDSEITADYKAKPRFHVPLFQPGV